MLRPDGRSLFSLRAVMAMVVLVVLAAFTCLTGCGDHHGTRDVAVSDSANNRVLIYKTPLSTGESATVVLGQADFVSNGTALTASGMNTPVDTAEDSHGNVFVSDLNNNRVLEFKPPFSSGMAASVVIGQPDFVTGTANTTQNGLAGPGGLTFDGSGNLWVADFGNNRILEFKPPFAIGMNASLVIGQADFVSNGAATTSSGLFGPLDLAFNGGNLWLTEVFNNRALEFKPPFATGMSASVVIGQPDFVSSGAATTDTGLAFPTGIAFDGSGNLWIGDTSNNRVLEFKPTFATGEAASLVLGQPDFVTAAVNTTQNGFDNPFGIGFDSRGNLGVTDPGNNRSLLFEPPFSTNQNASIVLGQADFVSSAAATTATGEASPLNIRALF